MVYVFRIFFDTLKLCMEPSVNKFEVRHAPLNDIIIHSPEHKSHII